MQSIENKVLSRIYGKGRGFAFSSSDFIDEFGANNIDKALSTLTKKSKIRRVARGVYDYPIYSKHLKKELSPDIDQIAHAYAREFNWQIEISGDSKLDKNLTCNDLIQVQQESNREVKKELGNSHE